MPNDVFVVEIKKEISMFGVTGRIEVSAPYWRVGEPNDEDASQVARSLAERIERAIEDAIWNFWNDAPIKEPKG